MKLKRSTKGLLRKVIQISYVLIFMFLGLGVAGNMDLDVPVPTWAWITLAITGFLTAGKIVYLTMKYDLKDERG